MDQHCVVEGCDWLAWSRGMCRSHYHRWRRYGDPLAGISRTRRDGRAATGDCSLDGCSNPAYRTVLSCGQHFELPGQDRAPTPPPRGAQCRETGCAKESFRHGLCSMHHTRRRRATEVQIHCRSCGATARWVNLCSPHLHRLKSYGDPLAGGAYHVNRGKPYAGRGGYLYVTDHGKRRPQHHVVMEQHLGRPLWPDERVHHLNGDRTDNRIENLELWSIQQPSGQRVRDKLAYARELLQRYAPEELAVATKPSRELRRRARARLRFISRQVASST